MDNNQIVENLLTKAFQTWNNITIWHTIENDDILETLQWRITELEIQPFIKYNDDKFQLIDNLYVQDDNNSIYRKCLIAAHFVYTNKID